MGSVDRQLLLAIVAPLCVWPWLPDWSGNSGTHDSLTTLSLVTLVPIIEEVLFRGFLQGWLLNHRRFNTRVAGASRANWLTSMAFAAAHLWQHAWLLFPGYLAVSLIFGHFRERYRGIMVPILLHGYYNLGLLIVTS